MDAAVLRIMYDHCPDGPEREWLGEWITTIEDIESRFMEWTGVGMIELPSDYRSVVEKVTPYPSGMVRMELVGGWTLENKISKATRMINIRWLAEGESYTNFTQFYNAEGLVDGVFSENSSGLNR